MSGNGKRIRENSDWWRGLSGEQKAAYLIELGRPRSLIERVVDAINVAYYWLSLSARQ
jgi:hypothetical protein